MRNAVLVLIALALSSIGIRAKQPPAREILAKVASVYATCERYYDEGTIKSNSQPSRNFSFRSTFDRPAANFAFELWSGEVRNARNQEWGVWKSGDRVESWAPPNSLFNLSDAPLDISLIRLVNQSAGSSLMVPPLLYPTRFRTADVFTLGSDWKVMREESIDGRQTFLIEGTVLSQPVKLWVDQTQYLIRRVVRQNTTVNYKPKIAPAMVSAGRSKSRSAIIRNMSLWDKGVTSHGKRNDR